MLFNVTGGYDMSMAEIQEAAEIITSAVSPNANIIVGATLKPEMEDDLVITVIATGFDSETFHDRDVTLDVNPVETSSNNLDEEMVQNIDMELEHKEAAEHFAAEDDTNIWDNPPEDEDDDEDDTPAFLRRRKKNRE